MTRNAVALIASATFVVACNSDRPDGGQAAASGSGSVPATKEVAPLRHPMEFVGKQRALLGLQPLDLSTSTGSAPPAIQIASEGLVMTAAMAEEIAAAATIRTWPELGEIEVSKQITMPSPGDRNLVITLAPKTTLPDRWYVVRLEKVPSWLSLPRFPAFSTVGGIATARFRPGREAKFMGAQVCRKSDDRYTVTAYYSERVNVTADKKPLDVHEGPSLLPASCVYVADEPYGSAIGPKVAPAGTTVLTMVCSGATPPKKLSVDTSGVSALDGRAVALHAVLDADKLEPWGPDCGFLRPE